VLGARTHDARHLSDGMSGIARATRQLVADTEEILAQSHKILANSERLLEATARLRRQLERRGLITLREGNASAEHSPGD
jgi:methyl-accepting chemotaxis protein